MSPQPTGPEQEARERIDALLEKAGWLVQTYMQHNIHAGRGVAIREFPTDNGPADYILYVDQKPVGVLEAKPLGFTLSGVEGQALKYAKGFPTNLNAPVHPLPFLYLSTGGETKFTNLLDPKPRSRGIFQFHRPSTLADWLSTESISTWTTPWQMAPGVAEPVSKYGSDPTRPSTLRSRILTMPPLDNGSLYPNQVEAIRNLEASLKKDRPKALIQMATGSGKTLMAITSIYRLIKFGGARRVLFLVDRSNLGEQAEKEFQGYRSPDDMRKFTDLYKVQRLATNTIGASSKVVITTIQRLYSMLKGEPEFDPELEDESQFEAEGHVAKEPLPVVYNPTYPPETFDVVVVDECHRSIYTLWRQVLEYFDSYIVGLTATPAKHTYAFFDGNVAMEYPHAKAVADGVNVDFEVYRIRTRITKDGSTIEAAEDVLLPMRDRNTREVRWESPDEDLTYAGSELDRNVVAKDQIRTIVRAFRDNFLPEAFPHRENVPKTLIFAKDDSHAEDIVEVIRNEFGKGNAFCQKITYKTTGAKPADLIQEFRNSFFPRIAVTVDMISTGTDIRPIEVVVFMRAVHSRVLFEQMKGRGVRTIDNNELKAVTPDADSKTHFVIVDCVGVTEANLGDTYQLERKKSVSLKELLRLVSLGVTETDVVTTLASRLARLNRRCANEDRQKIQDVSGGPGLSELGAALVASVDDDKVTDQARIQFQLAADQEPSDEQMKAAGAVLRAEAVKPLDTNPDLRECILDTQRKYEQVIDEVSQDELLFAGASEAATEKAKAVVASFEQFVKEHGDEYEALRFYYQQPYGSRLRRSDIKALAEAIKSPPRAWTPEVLWRAYEVLKKDKVRGASGQRLLTDILSLVRFALHRDDELVPYADQVQDRYMHWLAQQENEGRRFTDEQVQWLNRMADHIAKNAELEVDDFDLAPFVQEGGLGRVSKVFGKDLPVVLRELNEALVA